MIEGGSKPVLTKMASRQITASLGEKGNQRQRNSASKEIISNLYLLLTRYFGGGPFVQSFDIGCIFILNRWMGA
jgi:hypothetical protein